MHDRLGVPMDWSVAVVVATLALCCALRDCWRARGRAWPAWTLRLSATRQALLEWLRLNTTIQLDTVSGILRLARAQHNDGNHAEALAAIREADTLAALHVRLWRAWLQGWSDVSRTCGTTPEPVTVDWPVPPCLSPLRHLRWASRLGNVVLPTRSARFHLGVQVRRLALQCAGWRAGAARLRADTRAEIGPALDELEATHAVLAALDAQGLATLDGVLHVLPEVRHPAR